MKALKIKDIENSRLSVSNALNQTARFTQGSKRIECVYDYRNRRVEKAVYEGDTLRTRTRFIYRGYLQIAELDASTATESHPAILRKTYLWDPSESTATRILALTSYDATGTYEAELYCTHDAQKNTTALFGIQAGRRAMYQYSAYGSLLKIDGDLAALNPFRFLQRILRRRPRPHLLQLPLLQPHRRQMDPPRPYRRTGGSEFV